MLKPLIVSIKSLILFLVIISAGVGIYSYYSNAELIGRYGIPLLDKDFALFLKNRLSLYVLLIGLIFSLRFNELGWYSLVFALSVNFIFVFINAFIPPFDERTFTLFKVLLSFFCLLAMFASRVFGLYSIRRINYLAITLFFLVAGLLWLL